MRSPERSGVAIRAPAAVSHGPLGPRCRTHPTSFRSQALASATVVVMALSWGCSSSVSVSPVTAPYSSGSTTGFDLPPLQPDEPGPAPVEELGRRHADEGPAPAPTARAEKADGAQSQTSPAPASPATASGARAQREPDPVPGSTPSVPGAADSTELPPNAWPNFRNGPQLCGIATTALPEMPELLW